MARGPSRFEDDDDAPWLEEGVPEARRSTLVPRGRLIGGIALFIALAMLVGIGIFVIVAKQEDGSSGYATPADAPLIAADGGPDKVTPADPGGMAVAGAGETIYAAGGGVDPGSAIDIGALPEEPLARPEAPGAESPVPGAPVDLIPNPATVEPEAPAAVRIEPTRVTPRKPKEEIAAATVPPPAPPPAPGGTTSLQLGAFSSSAKADAAWKTLAGRYTYLAGLDKRVDKLDRDGATLYRLRAGGVGSKAAAADLCARLRIAGEPCLVAE